MSADKDNKLGDVFKKVLNTGIGAAFMTEEAVKNMLGDLPLPKEMIGGLLNNAKNTKEEFIKAIKTELKGYLDNIDLSKEIDKVLEKYDVEVNATFRLKPKSEKKVTKKKKS